MESTGNARPLAALCALVNSGGNCCGAGLVITRFSGELSVSEKSGRLAGAHDLGVLLCCVVHLAGVLLSRIHGARVAATCGLDRGGIGHVAALRHDSFWETVFGDLWGGNRGGCARIYVAPDGQHRRGSHPARHGGGGDGYAGFG